MNIRKITSLTMMLSFILCLLTSIVLYITPYGRVAYWSDWHFWGFNKTQWSELHLNLGILFLVAGFLHIFYNWRPLMAYLKNKARRINLLTGNFATALFLTLAVGIGTYFEIPPLSSIIDFSTKIKDTASNTYGEPPYGHAELSSLKMFTDKVNLDLAKSQNLLRQSGMKLSNEKQTVLDIAKNNNRTPKEIYEIIKPAAIITGSEIANIFPGTPPPGFGNKTLYDICQEFKLERNKIQVFLAQRGIHAEPASSIKKIAADNSMEPMSLFEILSEFAKS